MKNALKILIFFCLLLTPLAYADVINVPSEQQTIQAAIDISSEGDTILVAVGHYMERVSFHGKNVLVTSEFLFDPDPSIIQETVIDGAEVLPNDGASDTASVVIFVSGEGPAATLYGFTITRGKGTLAGIYGNSRKGGGIFCVDSSPTIMYNYIKVNEAADGGGIYATLSSARIEHNTIFYNAAGSGGGIMTRNSDAHIINNTIDSNLSDEHGAGITATGDPQPLIRNNIVSYNVGWGIESLCDDSLLVDYDNVFSDDYGSYLGNVIVGPGEIHCPPEYIDAFAGNYQLEPFSPSLEAGSNDYGVVPPNGGDRLDQGAWEYHYVVGCNFLRFFDTPTQAVPCDTISWDIRLRNKTDSTQVYDIWIDVSGPKCRLIDYILDWEFPAKTTFYGTVKLYVPCNAPPGLYIPKGKVGEFDDFIFTVESFEGEVLPAPRKILKHGPWLEDGQIVQDEDWWVQVDVDPRPVYNTE
jgi:hypothetical protein